MPKHNLHLFLSDIVNETRLFKEAVATVELKVFDSVSVVGTWDVGLEKHQIRADGLEVVRVQTWLKRLRTRYPNFKRGLLSKILAVLGFLQYMFEAIAVAIRKKPTHISCHNLFLLPVSVISAWIVSAKMIYVPHELETERQGLKGWMKKISGWIESSCIKSCDAVVVVAEPIANWYRKRYGISIVHVVRAIPSVKRPQDVQTHRATVRQKLGIPEGAIVFIYQGILAKERGVDYLIDIFAKSDSTHHIIFMGFGEAEKRIQAASESNARIHFQPAVPMSEILKHTCAADIGLNVIPGGVSDSYRVSLPNKFFEYLFAGLPVLVGANLEHLAELIVQHDIGWVIDSNGPPNSLFAIDLDQLAEKKKAVQKFVTENSWDVERAKYIEIYS